MSTRLINYESFQALAPYHDTIINRDSPLLNKENRDLEKYIKTFEAGGNKIIDVGCGTGDLCLYFANIGYNVTGIDYSDNFLLVARNKLNYLRLSIKERNEFTKKPNFIRDPGANIVLSSVDPKIKFIKDNITEIEYIREKYNYAMMLDLLSFVHFNDLASVFENAAKVIYPNGVFLFQYKTVNEFIYCGDVNRKNKSDNKYVACSVDFKYDDSVKMAKSFYNFECSESVKTSFSLEFSEFNHDFGLVLDELQKNHFEILNIIPDAPVNTDNISLIKDIVKVVEETYNKADGVKNIIVVARKK